MHWSVMVETDGGNLAVVDDSAIGEFLDELRPHSGVVTGDDGYPDYGAMITVQAHSAAEAVTAAVGIVTTAAVAAGLPALPVVKVEAIREDAFDRELYPDMAHSSPR